MPRPQMFGRHVPCSNSSSVFIEVFHQKQREMTMDGSKTVTKDPICGMTVDESTALHSECDGKTFYFCSPHCQEKFLSMPAGAKADEESEDCCGQ